MVTEHAMANHSSERTLRTKLWKIDIQKLLETPSENL
jgi:hypothetical protein